MRPHTELVEVFRGKALNNGGPNYFATEIPVSAPVTTAYIRVNHTLTIGTGSGAISEGELGITKAISLRSDRNEYFLKNVPGRGLYRFNQYDLGTAGDKDAIAAASNVYSVIYVIPFCNFNMVRPFDTVLDNTRYKQIELMINQGTIADLLTTVGTATISSTVDLYFRQLKTLDDGSKPLFIREIGGIQPINPASQTYMDLERTASLAYASVLLGTDNSATLGTPFSGTPAGNVVSDIAIQTNIDYPFKSVLADVLKRANKFDLAESTASAGRYFMSLIGDGSYKSALHSGDFSMLRAIWTNGTLSTSQVSGIYDGIRDLSH